LVETIVKNSKNFSERNAKIFV